MGNSVPRKSFYCTSKSIKMAFLVKYIAFVAAILSATQLAESSPIKMVDATDPKAVQDYAEFVSHEHCVPFDPLDTDLLDAKALDAETLYQLLVLKHSGALLETCVPKEGDRIIISGTAVVTGLLVNAISNWFG